MNWHPYLYGFARHAAVKSKDPTQVGAVLVGSEREVRLTAFNGPPKGVADFPERFERPAKYLFASHAEANLIAFAAREGIRTKDCSVYVTHHPCSACARALIQAGVKRVLYGPGITSMPKEEFETASTMFREAGIVCVGLDADGEQITLHSGGVVKGPVTVTSYPDRPRSSFEENLVRHVKSAVYGGVF